MSWDSDTIPLRRVGMFDQAGKPYFDTKLEYNPGYFKTFYQTDKIEFFGKYGFDTERHISCNYTMVLSLKKDIPLYGVYSSNP
jgi:hypothetical protein